MPADRGRGIVFFHIPKTGGTSIERALGLLGDPNKLDPDRIFGWDDGISEGVQHLPPSHIRRFLTEEELRAYFKFTIVRNPFDRMVSEYAWRYGEQGAQDSRVRFAEFVDWVDSLIAGGEYRDDLSLLHLWPQSDYVFDERGRGVMDFVGRFEQLQADFDKVCELTGLAPVTLGREQKSRRRPCQAYYDPRTIEKVSAVYHRDFETLYPELLSDETLQQLCPERGRAPASSAISHGGAVRRAGESSGDPGHEQVAAPSLDSDYAICVDVAFTVGEDNVTITPLGGERSYRLDLTGREVWLHLARGRSPRVILEDLIGAYEGSAADIERDLRSLLGTLLEYRLIEEVAGGVHRRAQPGAGPADGERR